MHLDEILDKLVILDGQKCDIGLCGVAVSDWRGAVLYTGVRCQRAKFHGERREICGSCRPSWTTCRQKCDPALLTSCVSWFSALFNAFHIHTTFSFSGWKICDLWPSMCAIISICHPGWRQVAVTFISRSRTFRRRRFSAHRFGTGTSRRWDISAPAVSAPTVSVPDTYATAMAISAVQLTGRQYETGVGWTW